eukprot:6120203-Pyramimonas_sp.AAC.1
MTSPSKQAFEDAQPDDIYTEDFEKAQRKGIHNQEFEKTQMSNSHCQEFEKVDATSTNKHDVPERPATLAEGSGAEKDRPGNPRGPRHGGRGGSRNLNA